nr:class I SAM-dependent methyltransferase [Halomarina oriensis]
MLDVGGGVGTMLDRLQEWDLVPAGTRYTLLDADAALVATARERLADVPVETTFVADDLLAFADGTDRRYDACVAAAVLDLLDGDRALDALATLAPGGLLYAPVTFDGVTLFSPPRPDDERVLGWYHDHMTARDGSPAGGRRLLAALSRSDCDTLAVAPSDWHVHPPYHEGETRFLAAILDTVEEALTGFDPVENGVLSAWLTARRDTLAAGELAYVAHNLDVLVRLSAPLEH